MAAKTPMQIHRVSCHRSWMRAACAPAGRRALWAAGPERRKAGGLREHALAARWHRKQRNVDEKTQAHHLGLSSFVRSRNRRECATSSKRDATCQSAAREAVVERGA
jgi:hypothetical protein